MKLLTTIILACQISNGAKVNSYSMEAQFICQKELIKCVKKKTDKNVYHLINYTQEQYIGECIEERK